jgi:hypothetical protein
MTRLSLGVTIICICALKHSQTEGRTPQAAKGAPYRAGLRTGAQRTSLFSRPI